MVAANDTLPFDAIIGVDVYNVLALLGNHHTWSPNSSTQEDVSWNDDQSMPTVFSDDACTAGPYPMALPTHLSK